MGSTSVLVASNPVIRYSKSTVAWVSDPSVSMLANRQPDRCGSQIGATKSVPGTRRGARSDASK